jgi:hypothetical protein
VTNGPASSTVLLRPLGSPVALGLAGLTAASLVVSGVELGWIAAAERHHVALILLAFPFPLQFVACLIAFWARDGIAGTALGVLSTSWLATAVVWLSSPPAAVSGALGLLLLAAGALLGGAGAVGARGNRLPGAIFVVEGVRFVLAAIHELGAGSAWQDAAGGVGLAVVALAGSAMIASLLREAAVDGIAGEAGVRSHL